MNRNIREKIIKLAHEYDIHHVTSALSIVEILKVLYEVKRPEDEIILSKGHGCLALYVLLREQGLNPKISGHPDLDPKEGIFCTSGSLGHGLPIAVGKAMVSKYKHFYVIIGDGECQEGTIWESLQLISRYKLNNLTVIIDKNDLQSLSLTNASIPVYDLEDKLIAFGLGVYVTSGHSETALRSIIKNNNDKPIAIVALTWKGKGLKTVENVPGYHVYLPSCEELCEKQ